MIPGSAFQEGIRYGRQISGDTWMLTEDTKFEGIQQTAQKSLGI